MNVDFTEDTYEGLPFATALSMAMMERLDIRKMIDAESGKIDGRIYNLSTGMAAKFFIGSMTSEMGRRPIYRTKAVFDTAPKDKIFGPFVKPNGLNDRILRDRLTAMSKLDLQELQWKMYQHVTDLVTSIPMWTISMPRTSISGVPSMDYGMTTVRNRNTTTMRNPKGII